MQSLWNSLVPSLDIIQQRVSCVSQSKSGVANLQLTWHRWHGQLLRVACKPWTLSKGRYWNGGRYAPASATQSRAGARCCCERRVRVSLPGQAFPRIASATKCITLDPCLPCKTVVGCEGREGLNWHPSHSSILPAPFCTLETQAPLPPFQCSRVQTQSGLPLGGKDQNSTLESNRA